VFLSQRAAEFSFFYTKRSSSDLYTQTTQASGLKRSQLPAMAFGLEITSG
jgi:hypothetical protein